MSDCSTNAWRVPGKCPHEERVLDGKKSYCGLWERWTNCREAGHCVRESIEGNDSQTLL